MEEDGTGYTFEASEEEAFELEEDEAVVAVRSSTNGWGWLYGLEVTTSTGRKVSWGQKRSVVENAKLGFCSGMRAGYDYWRIIFHWMID